MESENNSRVTAGQIIDMAGGTGKVAQIFKCDPRVVSNWRSRGFPRDTYLEWQEILKEIGVTAPPALWGQRSRSA